MFAGTNYKYSTKYICQRVCYTYCVNEGRMDMKEDYRKKKRSIRLLKDTRPSPIVTDPQGCYTGRPLEAYEQPVQDADDL